MSNAKPTLTIMLYGNSILMETLTSKLHKIEDWEVTQIAGGEIRDIGYVDFIVTDLCDAATSTALPMLCGLPGVVLIGVDAIANTLTVLTGRTRPLNSTQGVMDALKNAI
ncbi:MAG: hypothetical protein AABZ00_17830 [Chloroflexota bacterium]